jgi:hypothetical protein
MSISRVNNSIFEKRKYFSTKLREELRCLDTKLKRLEMTNENISCTSSAGKDIDFASKTIEHNKNRIIEITSQINELQKKLNGVMFGQSDIEIETLYKANVDHVAEAEIKKAKQDAAVAEREAVDRARGDAYMTSERKEIRNEKYMEKTIQREYAKLCDIVTQVPEYIKRNLENMPNNKGYRWRGVIFFGKLPEEPNGPMVIFEKKYENTCITECSATNYTEWMKTRDGAKQLVVSYRRKTCNNRGPAKLY